MLSQLLPEFFALLGIDLFLFLSLLSCVLDDGVPKALPYVYQMAALVGFGHLLISKNFIAIFGEYTRFWYSFIYLLVALASVLAMNLYFAVAKRQWTLATFWSGVVAFPTIVVSTFFVSHYTFVQRAVMPLLTLQAGLVISVVVMGICFFIFLSPEAIRNALRRKGR